MIKMKFKIHKQEIERIDDDKIASFSRNHIHATFIFDKLWKDLRKFALFVTPNDKKYIVDLGYGQTIKCIVPDEALEGSFFKVSCFADDLLTTIQETVLVYPSGYSYDIDDLDLEDENVTSSNDNIEFRKRRFDEDCFVRPQKLFEKQEHIHD